ncbi:MAG: uracil-DNA glycosylase [Shimia sp.]
MTGLDWHGARAALEWQWEAGVIDAIEETPIDRYAADAQPAPETKAAAAAPAKPKPQDIAEEAAKAARAAPDLATLHQILAAFDGIDFKRGARNCVFADGTPGAPVMVIGEAPTREEDREGKPFAGREGALLDKMLAAIGLSRAENVYLTLTLPWRLPARDPRAEEVAMMRPFVQRHVELAAPKVVLLMGNLSTQAALQKKGIGRLRGQWSEAYGRPALPMHTPARLLQDPSLKRGAWEDLLTLQHHLRTA